MGNAESTLAFKKQFGLLHSQPSIPEKDPLWNSIVNACIDHHQVFGVLGLDDIRRIRDSNPENLETLILVVVKQLQSVIKPSGMGSVIEDQVLSYLRALTRMIPVVYEKPLYAASIEQFLWNQESGVFANLLNSLLRLVQLPGFCVPLQGLSLWAAGIGAQRVTQPSKQNQYNKIELLRILLVLLGEPLYCIEPHGLNILASKDANDVAYLFCSLINTGVQEPSSFAIISQSNLTDLSLASLMLLVIFHGKNTNSFRKLLAKIYRQDDLQLLVERLSNSLSIPTASLLWELLQANPKFRPLPAEPIVAEIVANQYDRKQDDYVRILTFILIQQSLDLQWCSENAAAMARLYTPFTEANIHTPALLDLLHNISPLLQIRSEEQVNEFGAYIESIMMSKNKDYKLSVASSLGFMLAENKTVVFRLKNLKHTGDERLDGYFSTIRDGNFSTAQEMDTPPMQNTRKFEPVKINWDAAKMRWYNSAIWGHAMQSAEIRNGLTPWSNTDIQLFKVEIFRQTPTLRNPKGAVEEIGNMIWGLFNRQ